MNKTLTITAVLGREDGSITGFHVIPEDAALIESLEEGSMFKFVDCTIDCSNVIAPKMLTWIGMQETSVPAYFTVTNCMRFRELRRASIGVNGGMRPKEGKNRNISSDIVIGMKIQQIDSEADLFDGCSSELIDEIVYCGKRIRY